MVMARQRAGIGLLQAVAHQGNRLTAQRGVSMGQRGRRGRRILGRALKEGGIGQRADQPLNRRLPRQTDPAQNQSCGLNPFPFNAIAQGRRSGEAARRIGAATHEGEFLEGAAAIGAGAVTYIVGPVTGAALGASSDVMALSIATGLIKAILVMVFTPVSARLLALDNPRSAMVFGGLAGTVSGVTAGLAATDRRLVPYGALTATFHTGLGCLMGPSILYFCVRGLVG